MDFCRFQHPLTTGHVICDHVHIDTDLGLYCIFQSCPWVRLRFHFRVEVIAWPVGTLPPWTAWVVHYRIFVDRGQLDTAVAIGPKNSSHPFATSSTSIRKRWTITSDCRRSAGRGVGHIGISRRITTVDCKLNGTIYQSKISTTIGIMFIVDLVDDLWILLKEIRVFIVKMLSNLGFRKFSLR